MGKVKCAGFSLAPEEHQRVRVIGLDSEIGRKKRVSAFGGGERCLKFASK